MWKCQLHSHTWPAEIGIHARARARARVGPPKIYISRDDAPCESPDEYIYTAAPPPSPRAPLRGGVLFSPKLAESQRLIFPRAIKILATSG